MFALADFDNLRATLFCKSDTRRVRKIRHEVEKLNSATLRLHSLYRLLQGDRRNAVIVCENVFDVSLVVSKDSDRADIRRAFGKNHIALVEKQPGHQIECVLRAGCHNQIVW